MTELIDDLIKLTPEAGEDAKFYSYPYIYHRVLDAVDDNDDLTDIVISELSPLLDELFNEHSIALQLDAVHEGTVGIRLMSVE